MELKKIVRNNFNIEISGMPDLIHDLSKSNSLLLYSDHAKEWIYYIQEKHPFMQFFKKSVFSFEQKCLKSDKNAFPDLLKLLQINNSDTLFIDFGDSIEVFPLELSVLKEVKLKCK